jgi:tryptophan-rich sensory protein
MILVANEEYPMAHLLREMLFDNHLTAHQILNFAWHFWHFQLVGLILGLIGLGLLVLFWSKTQLPSDHFAVFAFALFGTWLMVGSALQIASVLI